MNTIPEHNERMALTKNVRILDKLVDELAKGKKMEVFLRSNKN
jgi:hypothetical protein